jgi:hypothetical protein
LTTAKGATGPAQASGAPEQHWWAIAGALLGIALGAVLVYAVFAQSTGRLSSAPAPFIANGSDLVIVQGTGRKDGQWLVLEAPGAEGVAVLTANLAPFPASDFSRVEWTIDSAQPAEMLFVWRTREHSRRNYTKRLQWLVSGVAPLELTADDGWRGTITGVALLVRSNLPVPLRVGSVRIVSRSASAVATEIFRQWGTHIVLRGYSIGFPFDAERAHDLTALIAVAFAEGLALSAYVLLARWRGWRRDRRVLWGIFLGGWLLLDLRWQANLWGEVGERAKRFAGKTADEKHLAAEDAPLFALVEKMKTGLPAAPARIVLYCDNAFICARAAFFLYPQNVHRAVHRGVPPPTPDELKSGDYLLLIYSRALGYDRERQLAVWRDGRSRPAEEILLQPEALLLRVK